MTSILLAEDNSTLLDTIAFELEMQGYEVAKAENGQMALDLLKSDPLPDIIVSDLAMPDVNGYELLENVRANDRLQHIPVLFLTAFDSANAVSLAKDLGVDDYITKPFEPEELFAAIESKLAR